MEAQEVYQRSQEMFAEKSMWDPHWEEVAKYVWPSYSGAFRGGTTPGEKRDYQYDSTAVLALSRFAATLESMLTPRQNTWHYLQSPVRNRRVQLYLDEVNRILFRERYAPVANFSSQLADHYMSLGAFGTGCLFVDEGPRYKAISLNEVAFATDYVGMVDTVYRKFELTGRQAVQQFKDVPKDMTDKPDQKYEILHCVMPNREVDTRKADRRGMKYYSAYVYKDKFLREGGYETFPYMVSRYVTSPGETYGRSPAMMVLASVKTLNEEKKTILKQGQRVVDPVLLAYDDGVMDAFSLKPGALNFGGVNSEGRPLIHTLPTGNLSVGFEMMKEERGVINDAFLVTLFQILVETPQMTATEVMERAREKGSLLAPTMGRQQSELLGPMIARELDILLRMGKLPEPPPEFRKEYKVVYDSPMSRVQQAEEGAGTMRMIQWASEIAAQTQDPSVFDHFDFDTIIPELGSMNAVPARFIADRAKVEAKRQGRAETQRTQQLIDAAPSIASMVKQ